MTERTTTDSWLQPHLVHVLRRGLPVLSHWRTQTGLSGHIKNLENWILVELNHRLLESGDARVVLTNGFFAEGQDVLAPKRVAANQIPGLRASKAKARYLSVDLSVRPRSGPREYWVAELKTGLAAVTLLDDLRLVRFYRQGRIATRAELGWVVLLPEKEPRRRACEKTFEKIVTRLNAEPGGCTVLTRWIEDWLVSVVVIPKSGALSNDGKSLWSRPRLGVRHRSKTLTAASGQEWAGTLGCEAGRPEA